VWFAIVIIELISILICVAPNTTFTIRTAIALTNEKEGEGGDGVG